MSLSAIFTKDEVLSVLSKHVGKDKGIRADILVRTITGSESYNGGDERYLRKVVTGLRLEGAHICSSPKNGYYMAANDKELDESCELLFIRSMKSLSQVAAMRNQAMPDLRGQLRLPLQQEDKHVSA